MDSLIESSRDIYKIINNKITYKVGKILQIHRQRLDFHKIKLHKHIELHIQIET